MDNSDRHITDKEKQFLYKTSLKEVTIPRQSPVDSTHLDFKNRRPHLKG